MSSILAQNDGRYYPEVYANKFDDGKYRVDNSGAYQPWKEGSGGPGMVELRLSDYIRLEYYLFIFHVNKIRTWFVILFTLITGKGSGGHSGFGGGSSGGSGFGGIMFFSCFVQTFKLLIRNLSER